MPNVKACVVRHKSSSFESLFWSGLISVLGTISVSCGVGLDVGIHDPFEAGKSDSTSTSAGCQAAVLGQSKTVFSGGSGTASDPYLICNVHQLQLMGSSLSSYHELAGNIDASETNPSDVDFNSSGTWGDRQGFLPIGGCGPDYNCLTNYRDDDDPFSGSLNGADYTISALFISRNRHAIGLFGQISSLATITKLNMTIVSINQGTELGTYVGAIVGKAAGRIELTTVSGSVSGNRSVGGMVGQIVDGTLSYSSSTANVSAYDYAGGLIGETSGATTQVSDCTASGTVTAYSGYVGGLIGLMGIGTLVRNCHASGNVTGGGFCAGGLVGYSRGAIYASSATGSVTGYNATGGLVGALSGSSGVEIDRSFAKGNVTVTTNRGGGLVGYSYINPENVEIYNSYRHGNNKH